MYQGVVCSTVQTRRNTYFSRGDLGYFSYMQNHTFIISFISFFTLTEGKTTWWLTEETLPAKKQHGEKSTLKGEKYLFSEETRCDFGMEIKLTTRKIISVRSLLVVRNIQTDRVLLFRGSKNVFIHIF